MGFSRSEGLKNKMKLDLKETWRSEEDGGGVKKMKHDIDFLCFQLFITII